MNSNTRIRAGFTKTGFSKTNLACCSHYAFCDMGKLKCHYDITDPEVKEYCAAYIRNHSNKPSVESIMTSTLGKEDEEKNMIEELVEQENGQYSLF